MTERQIDRRLANGAWSVVVPTVYVLDGAPRSRAQALLAVSLWVEDRGGLSHLTAAEGWDLAPTFRTLHATVALPAHQRSRANLVVHRSRNLPLEHLACHDGLRLTSIPRTLLDTAPLVRRD